VECFRTAIECAKKVNSTSEYLADHYSNEFLADIYNNLGIAYYELTEYDKAQESFDTALELDSDFELANHNKSLTVQKIGERTRI
jgi:lipoprotein NlpI